MPSKNPRINIVVDPPVYEQIEQLGLGLSSLYRLQPAAKRPVLASS